MLLLILVGLYTPLAIKPKVNYSLFMKIKKVIISNDICLLTAIETILLSIDTELHCRHNTGCGGKNDPQKQIY